MNIILKFFVNIFLTFPLFGFKPKKQTKLNKRNQNYIKTNISQFRFFLNKIFIGKLFKIYSDLKKVWPRNFMKNIMDSFTKKNLISIAYMYIEIEKSKIQNIKN